MTVCLLVPAKWLDEFIIWSHLEGPPLLSGNGRVGPVHYLEEPISLYTIIPYLYDLDLTVFIIGTGSIFLYYIVLNSMYI